MSSRYRGITEPRRNCEVALASAQTVEHPDAHIVARLGLVKRVRIVAVLSPKNDRLLTIASTSLTPSAMVSRDIDK